MPALIALVREKGFTNDCFFWFGNLKVQEEFIRLAPEMKLKVNASNVAGLQKWLDVCSPSIVEVGVKNITPEFRSFCRSHGIKTMAAVFDGKVDEFKEAILCEADMVNLDQPEVFEEIINKF